MKATYKGKEVAVEVFGCVFPRGMAVEVTDEHAMSKLPNHPEFSCDGAPVEEAPKRRGRPPKVQADGENQG